jgi:hypothetical protein
MAHTQWGFEGFAVQNIFHASAALPENLSEMWNPRPIQGTKLIRICIF